MDIKQLTPTLSVSSQIGPEHAPAIAAAGFRTVICNRPDTENPEELQSALIGAAIEAQGLTFVTLPFDSKSLTPEVVVQLREMIASAEAPVLAYCRTGTRCTNAWALGQAGDMPAQDIVSAAAAAGYDISKMAPYLIQKITI
ncbi:TIGR01244 family sulfur transferase [Alisedimentitalea sp. MJ-SS2]|uniref:TIGR01244 family sulfur transferase n=1 Tax=Aliisedimentitalea sp. MJ-SS2 TaxID=3049795 RepID=UPI002907B423|nr:TIGR01244 family sulfur transferase [Alisedimentitalea sp. MJ-SS2]MDU8929103.1 TIGR01244 family sulfur transferase [Alisedimentitalea sp. MJ-SS2]